MAIIINNDGDRIVQNLADRDSVDIMKFDGMKVTVIDSTGDVNTGNSGKATYQWYAFTSTWLLIWKENSDSLEFITESLVISVAGKVTASHVPQSGMVWGVTVQDQTDPANPIIIADVKPTIFGDSLDIGSLDFTGKTLVFTYGYGLIQAAVTAILSGGGGVSSADLALKAPIASPTFTGTVSGISATMVGLGNVDNTTDALKPISTATQSALALKATQATTYTKTESDARIQAVVGAAPLALDTLVEIAAQMAIDESTSAALVNTVSLKAPIASPTFTGTPTAPNAAAATNTTQVATTAFVLANSVQKATVNTVANTISDGLGNLRSVMNLDITAARSLAAADNGRNLNLKGAYALTMPSTGFMAGDIISVYNMHTAANTITIGSGLTCYLMGTAAPKTGSLTLAIRGGLTIMYISATEVLVSGNV